MQLLWCHWHQCNCTCKVDLDLIWRSITYKTWNNKISMLLVLDNTSCWPPPLKCQCAMGPIAQSPCRQYSMGQLCIFQDYGNLILLISRLILDYNFLRINLWHCITDEMCNRSFWITISINLQHYITNGNHDVDRNIMMMLWELCTTLICKNLSWCGIKIYFGL